MCRERLAATALLSICLFFFSIYAGSILASETATYEYDALGRLEKVTREDGTETTVVDYEYDSAGNRLKRTVGDGSSNSPPNAVSDTQSIPTTYVYRYLNATANDNDPDGDPLTITAVTQPSNGFVTIYTASTLRIFSTQVGTDTFTYTISDGNGGTDFAMVTLTVFGGGGGPPPP